MVSPHIQLEGVIDNDSLKGDIRLPVTLQQTVWVGKTGIIWDSAPEEAGTLLTWRS